MHFDIMKQQVELTEWEGERTSLWNSSQQSPAIGSHFLPVVTLVQKQFGEKKHCLG